MKTVTFQGGPMDGKQAVVGDVEHFFCREMEQPLLLSHANATAPIPPLSVKTHMYVISGEIAVYKG